MIERVARALYARAPLSGGWDLPDHKVGLGPVRWEDAPKHEQNRFYAHARAVLAAIRDLPAYLRSKACESENVVAWGDYGEFWTSAIDAALAEGGVGVSNG